MDILVHWCNEIGAGALRSLAPNIRSPGGGVVILNWTWIGLSWKWEQMEIFICEEKNWNVGGIVERPVTSVKKQLIPLDVTANDTIPFPFPGLKCDESGELRASKCVKCLTIGNLMGEENLQSPYTQYIKKSRNKMIIFWPTTLLSG